MASKTTTQELSDDLNPAFLFLGTFTELLSKIAKGEIDATQIAKQELAGRGLNIDGQWVGFEKAKKNLEPNHI